MGFSARLSHVLSWEPHLTSEFGNRDCGCAPFGCRFRLGCNVKLRLSIRKSRPKYSGRFVRRGFFFKLPALAPKSSKSQPGKLTLRTNARGKRVHFQGGSCLARNPEIYSGLICASHRSRRRTPTVETHQNLRSNSRRSRSSASHGVEARAVAPKLQQEHLADQRQR